MVNAPAAELHTDEPLPSEIEDLFATIAARAAGLEERLSSPDLTPVPTDPEVVQRRLDRWCEQTAKGDWVLFAEVLALYGLNLNRARELAGSFQLSNPLELPTWIEQLKGGLTEAVAGAGNGARFLQRAEPLPFEQVIAPFVKAAGARLRLLAGSAYDLLDDEAHAVAERVLLNWLANACAPSLMLEFSILRLKKGSLQTSSETSASYGSTALHIQFVDEMLHGGLIAFFSEYSVLAKAVATLMSHWASATAEFLTRLKADLPLLSGKFADGRPLGSVIGIQAGLSDPHHESRTAFAVKFSSGIKLVYKPKNVEAEVAYGELLDWMQIQGLSLDLAASVVLSRDGYGWVGYIDHSPCLTEEELARFYTRSGMLLALYHLLDTTDVHNDNLIAVREYPMLVDAETLITPPLRVSDVVDPAALCETAVLHKLERSIIKSAMVPDWRVDNAGNCHDMSGLGATGEEEIEVAVWHAADTDQMSHETARAKRTRNRNLPFPDDMAFQPSRFVDKIEAGFREAYGLLMSNRSRLLEAESPLERLYGAPMRLVFRDTMLYFSVLKGSLQPNIVRAGIDRSIELAALNRILCISQPRARHLPVVKAELSSLERFDIPAFTLFPANRALNNGLNCVDPEYFASPGAVRVREKLGALSAEDCDDQCELIRATFYAKVLNERESASRTFASSPLSTGASFTARNSFLDPAVLIAKDLGRRAITGSDGGCTWIALSYKSLFRGYRVGQIGVGLFDGSAGVAIFLAALEKLGARGAGIPSAQDVLKPVRRFLATVLEGNAWRRQHTGEMDAGLLIYPLLILRWLLDDPSLSELARRSAQLMVKKVFAEDKHFDIFQGTAGVLVGLVALHRAEPSAETLAAAICAGEQLIKPLQTNIAGRTLALNRLYNLTGDVRFRIESRERLMQDAWCKGPAGRGLSLLGASESSAKDQCQDELGLTLDAAGRLDETNADSVYEGLFGIVEFQLEFARRTQHPKFWQIAQESASRVTSAAGQGAQYRLFSRLPARAYSPGFYQGVSGIGYELLRLHDPESLPSLSMWEVP